MSDLTKGKKKRRYMKINLFETSVVGIPAYPDAHFSFIKALSKATDDSINTNERRVISMDTKENNIEQVQETIKEVTEEVKSEVQPEVAKTEEVEKAIEVPQKKAEDGEEFLKIVAALESALEKKLSESRGLVASQKEVDKAELKQKSLGELAFESGWFR